MSTIVKVTTQYVTREVFAGDTVRHTIVRLDMANGEWHAAEALGYNDAFMLAANRALRSHIEAATITALSQAYRAGAKWWKENGDHADAPHYLVKASRDYADKTVGEPAPGAGEDAEREAGLVEALKWEIRPFGWSSPNPFGLPFEATSLEQRNRIEIEYKKRVLSLLRTRQPTSQDAENEVLKEHERNIYSKLRVAFRRALADLPEIAPEEIRRVLSTVHMQDEFHAEGRRLQMKHGLDAVAPRVEQECGAGAWSFMRQGVLEALSRTRQPTEPGKSDA